MPDKSTTPITDYATDYGRLRQQWSADVEVIDPDICKIFETALRAIVSDSGLFADHSYKIAHTALVEAARIAGVDALLIVGKSRKFILAAIDNDEPALIDGVKQLFNCREVLIDSVGSIWICNPQAGHYLSDEDTALVENALRLGDI